MTPQAFDRLTTKLAEAIVARAPGSRVAIVGWTPAAFAIARHSAFATGGASLVGIFAPQSGGTVNPLAALSTCQADIVVIAEDAGKEALLEAIAPLVSPETRIIVGGYAHFDFSDPVFDRIRGDQLIPSLANGYPHCLVHIFQCLQNAERLGLRGAVAEFGMFKGGTTMLISRFIEALGADWKVYGFDTFDGFPAKRSPLDMYAHPDCVFRDGDRVRALFAGRNVEVVEGDIVKTVSRLAHEDLVLSFVDTDNFTSASAIIAVISERTLVGGVIIFDHWAGHDQYLDTIGERIAAKALASDPRYFNLHGTGVFMRQR